MAGLSEPLPQVGDVLLRRVNECPTDYVLCRCCGKPQLRCSAYLTAFDSAKRWARTEHVDVWLTDDNDTFVLLSRYRWDGQPAAPCRPAS